MSGILTERDVLARVMAEEIDPESRAIGELMTRDPETVELESSLAQAFHRMMVSDLRYLPLVDHEGRPVLIVTSRDLIDISLGSRRGLSLRDDDKGPLMRKTR